MQYRLAALLFFLITSCTKDLQEKPDLIKFIPKNTSYLLQSPSTSKFFKELDSTKFFVQNLFPEALSFAHILNLTELANFENALICFVPKNDKGFDYLMISDKEPVLNIDSIKNKSLETLKFQDYEIKKLTTEQFTTYSSKTGNIFLASTSLDLLKKSLSTEEDKIESPAFDMVWAAADKKRTSIFINHKILDVQLLKMFSTIELPVMNLASWSVIDIEISNDNYFFNGVVSSEAGSPEILNLFEGVAPQKNELSRITPSSAAGFFSFTYENFENLHRNVNKLRNDTLKFSPNHLLNFTKEAGVIYGEQEVFVLTTTDPELAGESMESMATASEFRGVTIKETADPDQFRRYLSPLINMEGLKYYAAVEKFLIFSESVQALENIIANYQNNTTLENLSNYEEAINNLANSSSFLLIANTSFIKNRLEDNISEEFKEELENLELGSYSIAALQLVKEQNFAHLHGFLKVSEIRKEEGVRQIASVKLNTNPGNLPVLTGSSTPNIIIQDVNNVLYSFNSKGNLQWKQKLESLILQEIHEVDISRNINLAFTTLNALHIMNLQGKYLKPFPVNFKDEITLPLSVFDYDNNSTYRFSVTQNDNLILYDSKGKIVKGFDFEKTESQILQSPKHLRLKNKDYIIFPELSGKLNILSRQGIQRVKVKDEIEFSGQEWYEHKGKFVSATPKGELVFVDEEGNIEKRALAGNTDVLLSATEKNLIYLSENSLTINEKVVTLDYGLYTRPKVFEAENKTYISVTDTQAQRVYVFDGNGNLYEGFPVYGNSSVDIKTFSDGAVYLLVQGEDSEIILYQM